MSVTDRITCLKNDSDPKKISTNNEEIKVQPEINKKYSGSMTRRRRMRPVVKRRNQWLKEDHLYQFPPRNIPFSSSEVLKGIDDESSLDIELQCSQNNENISKTDNTNFFEEGNQKVITDKDTETEKFNSNQKSNRNSENTCIKKKHECKYNTRIYEDFRIFSMHNMRNKIHSLKKLLRKPIVKFNSWRKHSYCIYDFNLVSNVGSGSFSEVFAAEFRSTKQMCAIKMICKKRCSGNVTNQIWNEKCALQTLSDNSSFVQFYCCFQTIKHVYFVIEFLNAFDLDEHLSSVGSISEEHARFYAAEIVFAVNFLHEKDIIHKDLKPSNVIIDTKGHIKLIDFGLCRVGKSHEKIYDTVCGISTYVAPEMCIHCSFYKSGYNFSVDWWHVGCILHDMLDGFYFGKHFYPFTFEEINGFYNEDSIFKEGEVKFRKKLSPEGELLIKDFLSVNPENRLGCRTFGFEEIKSHVFFKDINWDYVRERKLSPPLISLRKTKLSDYRMCDGFHSGTSINVDDKIDLSILEGFECVNPLWNVE